jgi:hypothetical protein
VPPLHRLAQDFFKGILVRNISEAHIIAFN